MTLRLILVHATLALPLLALVEARAQSLVTQRAASSPDAASPSASSAPQAAANLPDACKLLTQADLEALFPGRPITSRKATLSSVDKGPQYNQSCTYTVKLPNPTSKLDTVYFASTTIVHWGGTIDGRDASVRVFPSMRSLYEKIAPISSASIQTLQGVGDEAVQEASEYQVTIRVRKADMIFFVTLDAYSPQTLPDAVALAGQAAKRWGKGGMIDGDP